MKLSVDRAHWDRFYRAYIVDENACCIMGHLYLAEGTDRYSLRTVGPTKHKFWERAATEINDSSLPDSEAEAKLIDLFAAHDITLEFIGARQ